MGLLEQHKEHKLQEKYQSELSQWKSQHDDLLELLEIVKTKKSSIEVPGIVLKAGEMVIGFIDHASLVEQVRTGPHYVGGNSGVSIPIGSLDGRSIRWHVGASKGHVVQAPPHAEATDKGQLIITSQRILFVGTRKTVECLFAKLVSAHINDGLLGVGVSNRQKISTFAVGEALDGWMESRLEIALALFHGDADKAIYSLSSTLSDIEKSKPLPPT